MYAVTMNDNRSLSLDHADRVVDLMRDQMSKNHGTRMELIIIWLILVEVSIVKE